MERSGRAARARYAVAAVFAVHGAVAGTFATRIPWLQDRLGAGTGALGLALVSPAVGAFAAMPLAGRLSHRFGGRAVTRATLAAWCAALLLPAFAPTLPALCVLLLLYGAAAGMCDVAMNAQGVVVEQRLGRSIMSGLHGMWSVGSLAGAGAGTLAAHAGLAARVHLSVVSAVLLAAGAVAGRGLLDVRARPGERPPPRFALPTRVVAVIGVVGFCATFAEGASQNWCAVYLKQIAGASPGVAAGCYTAFAFTMAVSRLLGDLVVRRTGPVAAIRLGGVLAAAGGVLVVSARSPAPGIAGFALLGLGVAVVVPLVFAAGGNAGPTPSQGVAGVATITYTAGLVAPGAVGALADLTSLPAAFGLVTAVTVVMALTAGALRPGIRPAGCSTDRPDNRPGRSAGSSLADPRR